MNVDSGISDPHTGNDRSSEIPFPEHGSPGAGTPCDPAGLTPVFCNGTDADVAIAQALPWLHEASNPYWDWLWDSPEPAGRQLKQWSARGDSEFSACRIVCWSEQNRIVGASIAMPGDELQSCRKGDLLALVNHLRREPDQALLERMRRARSLFVSVGQTDYYLSRIGVSPSARGRGIGRRLLEYCVDEGRRRGFRRFHLNVSADNTRAVRIYRAAGFVVTGDSTVENSPLHYYSMLKSI